MKQRQSILARRGKKKTRNSRETNKRKKKKEGDHGDILT